MRVLSHKKESLASIEFSDTIVRYIEVGTNDKGQKEINYLAEAPYKWDRGKILLGKDIKSSLTNLIEGNKVSVIIKRKKKGRASTLAVVIPDSAAEGNIAQIDPGVEKSVTRDEMLRNIKKILPVSGPQVIDFDIEPNSRETFVFAIRLEIAKKIVELFSDLEFNVERIELRSHALRLVLPSLKEPVLLIDGTETTAALSVWDKGFLKFLSYTRFEAEEIEYEEKESKTKQVIKSMPSTIFNAFYSEITKLSRFFKGSYRVLWTGSLPFQTVLQEKIKTSLGGRELERFNVSKHFINWPKDKPADLFVGVMGGALTHYFGSAFTMHPDNAREISTQALNKHLMQTVRRIGTIVLILSLVIVGGVFSFSFGYNSSLKAEKKRLAGEVDPDLEASVNERNSLIAIAKELSDREKTWTDLITFIYDNKGANTVSNLSRDDVSVISINGRAASRESLLAFEGKLKSNERFSEVLVDPTSFVSLDYVIKITLAEGL